MYVCRATLLRPPSIWTIFIVPIHFGVEPLFLIYGSLNCCNIAIFKLIYHHLYNMYVGRFCCTIQIDFLNIARKEQKSTQNNKAKQSSTFAFVGKSNYFDSCLFGNLFYTHRHDLLPPKNAYSYQLRCYTKSVNEEIPKHVISINYLMQRNRWFTLYTGFFQ